MNVTGEQVKTAMIAADIHKVDHHTCGMCGYMTAYLREGDQLYFDPGCDCGGRCAPEPRSWGSAAAWINMQSQPAIAEKLAASFGLGKSGG